ncbi:hypothetical protein BO82DRAFT_62147 [Aspergillus uvarum CBS 121591]|uniref:Secreted protein n=1 Tax=Aspergillus uvarum CBS 121591 TaxID=1448315 RepID=A0A319C9H4_9EURO|nr:hypothetical protein BO82DRAFT_62147 [Aspergillus uvarum CBS 121591]PYH82456.1 hypothetical protein BO82DRAFT_62147 [Aspergillus uvarum CBS 121591]
MHTSLILQFWSLVSTPRLLWGDVTDRSFFPWSQKQQLTVWKSRVDRLMTRCLLAVIPFVGCRWMDAMRMGAARVGGDHGMDTGGLGKVPDSMQVQCPLALFDNCDTLPLGYSILLVKWRKILIPANGYWKTSCGLNFWRGVLTPTFPQE